MLKVKHFDIIYVKVYKFEDIIENIMTKIVINSSTKVMNQAKTMAYRSVHIPKNLRSSVEIKISSGRVTIAKKK